jgi:tetratricopeptide (TPR) repeat protein
LSHAQTEQAKDWLVDAQVELQRAGTSVGNVLLLEAKIAQSEARFEDAMRLTQRAACEVPPCPDEELQLCNHPQDPCDEGCVTQIPCVGPRIEKRRAAKDCAAVYQAQIHLVRARSAAEQYDLARAEAELSCAKGLASEVCSHDLEAELHNVAALIHIAKGEYLQAARHLDREAAALRRVGNYREIPNALEIASAAYQQVGQIGLSADRLCRVARILYGRGEFETAWRYVQAALPMAESACSEATRIRLALLANEIALALTQRGESLPEPSKQDEGLEMLAPENASDSNPAPDPDGLL